MATAGDQIVLFGGVLGGTEYADTWIWDGTTWSERHPTMAPAARSDAAITSIGGRAVLYGGGSKAGDYADFWAWDGAGWTALPSSSPSPSSSSNFPSARAGAGMATLGSKVVLFGGIEGVFFNDTWEWDGTSWALRLPGMTPPARESFAMATLPDRVVVFGGWVGVDADDTWEWDGTAWRQRTPMVRPPRRSNHAMAALGTDVIMFGGYGDAHLADGRMTYFMNDTWRWDGGAWTDMNPVARPSRRRDHAMASDGQGAIVLFGGQPEGTEPDVPYAWALGDTWRWDGGTWTQLHPATAPAARYGHAMALLDGKIIMFGGFDGHSSLDDTWAWDGVDWTRRVPVQSPPPRRDASVAAVGHSLVLYGGGFPGTGSLDNIAFRDTWTWDGSNWLDLNAGPGPTTIFDTRLSYFQGKLLLLAFSGTWFGTIGRPGGAACALGGECATGFCSDGVCCDSACGGASTSDCRACSVAAGAASDGTCGSLGDGLVCSDGNPCSVGDRCVAGACTPTGALACTSTDACHATGPCAEVDGLCVSAPVADGTICGANLTCLSGRCLDTAAAAGGRAGLGGAGGGSGADAGLDLGRPGGAEKDLSSRGCGCAIRDADRQGAGIAMTVVAIALVLARRRTKRKRAETDRALLGRGEDHGHGRPGTTAEHGHSLW